MAAADVDRYLADIERKSFERGRIEIMLLMYEVRFGPPPKAIAATLGRMDDAALLRLIPVLVYGSAEDFARALRPARAPSPRSVRKLRSGASRPSGPTR